LDLRGVLSNPPNPVLCLLGVAWGPRAVQENDSRALRQSQSGAPDTEGANKDVQLTSLEEVDDFLSFLTGDEKEAGERGVASPVA
jgi:hypothetical protein